VVTKRRSTKPRLQPSWPKKVSFGRTRLRLLVKFLAINFDTVALEQFDRYDSLYEIVRCARYNQTIGSTGFNLVERRSWRRRAKAVQKELKSDLFNILRTTPTEQTGAVTRLVKKLEKVDSRCYYMTSYLGSVRGQPPKPVFSLRKYPKPSAFEEFHFKDRGAIICGTTVYSLIWAPEESLWDYVYWMLARAIEERCLEDLRICSECERLYVNRSFRQRYCGTRCKDEFHNRRRLREGYFPNYRKKIRAILFTKARRLLQKGHSILAVEEETKLSRRILERAGLIPHRYSKR